MTSDERVKELEATLEAMTEAMTALTSLLSAFYQEFGSPKEASHAE